MLTATLLSCLKPVLMYIWVYLGPTHRLTSRSCTQVWCYGRTDTQMQQDVGLRYNPPTRSFIHPAACSRYEQDPCPRSIDCRFDKSSSECDILHLSYFRTRHRIAAHHSYWGSR